jgi:hypothetical protein
MRKLLAVLFVTVGSTNSFAYYQAQQGRWMSRDRIGERGGVNLYAHTRNSPVNMIDNLGNSYGNPISGPNGPVGPANPFDPNPWAPIPPEQTIIEETVSYAQKLYNEWKNAFDELRKAMQEMKDKNVIGADKYYHCLGHCRAARSGSKQAADALGRLRELEELTRQRLLWHLDRYGIQIPKLKPKPITPIEHAQDTFEDYEANKTGFNCPTHLSCECCCEKYKVNGL